jgi:CHAT domain-containing protein
MNKPKAILLNVRAQYALLEDKNVANLSSLLNRLNDALAILERRKNIIQDSKDVGILMSDHAELLNFIKKLNLDLHNLTHDQSYIDRIIDLHESGLYSRIRSRLDKTDSIRFAHIPAEVQQKEKQLKAAVMAALEKNHKSGMDEYFSAMDEWMRFQETVKKEYPQYYKLRYQSIFRSLGDVQKSIPENTSLVRYFFIDKDLFALVADKKSRHLVALPAIGIEEKIRVLSGYGADVERTGEVLFQLYNQLWAPLQQHISHKKITIIPDGILFSLNFEILTPKKIRSFEQLASFSLLANHTISYHYSMYLVGQKNTTAQLDENFIAFAPGFLDEEKKKYKSGIRDSFELDRGYVSLLPQPFTIAFASRARNMLGGTAFINDESTAASFRMNAGRHKIIHIGTHAESNNLAPEFSRLIFSKTSDGNQNSIFLPELYNCDLSSELTVLTACESGKPGYQDGEGMISLAHAFNYAGSESILTGLWKIDEKASAMLMEQFYKYLMEGMEKDEALRQAKLDYLATARGRMLAPQYWAGLILMGDTSPVVLKKKDSNLVWLWALGGLAVIGSVAAVRKRKKNKKFKVVDV